MYKAMDDVQLPPATTVYNYAYDYRAELYPWYLGTL